MTAGPRTTFAVVGTGAMAKAMTEDLRRFPGTEVTAVLSRSGERAASFAAAYAVPRSGPLEDLPRVDADVVYIATPHDSHADLAVTALDSGRHVLVEKAFTTDAAEARRVVAAATRSGRFCMEAMWMRFNPAVQRLTALLARGDLGEPRTVHASFGRAVPYDPGHRLWDPARGGGSLLDQGVYPLTLADLVLGEPSSLHAAGSTLGYDGRDAGVDTEASLLLGYGDGRSALTCSSIRTALPRDAFVGGRDGLVRVDPPFWCSTGLTVERPGRAPERIDVAIEGRGYVPMLRAVHEAVAAGRREHDLMPWSASLRMMGLIDRARAQLGG